MKLLKRIFNPKTVVLLIAFGGVLLKSPQFIKTSLPCLQNPSASYHYQDCNLSLLLDRYVVFLILIFALFNLSAYLINGHLVRSRALVLAVVSAALSAAAFYWYIPQAQSAVDQVPIILTPESF